MNDLYIVSTYYHALIACVRHMYLNDTSEIMVTDYIPQHESLTIRLKKSGIFKNVICMGKINEYIPKNRCDFILNNNKNNACAIERQMGISLREYDNIYVFHDDTWMAHYLKCARIKYHLLEDSLDSFKNISKSPFSYMLRGNPFIMFLKNHLRIGYVFCGYDKYTSTVEVNSIEGIETKHLASKKLVELPRQPMFDRLSASELDILKNIFLKDIPFLDYKSYVLLLTQPLFADRVVASEYEHIEIYKDLIRKTASCYNLVIKPHPRDNVDYSVVFPEALVFEKNMPLEIIALVEKPHFAKVISFNTTCINVIKADEYVLLNENTTK